MSNRVNKDVGPSGVEVIEAVPSFSVELDEVTACTAGVSSLEINAAGLTFDAAVSRTAESVEDFVASSTCGSATFVGDNVVFGTLVVVILGDAAAAVAVICSSSAAILTVPLRLLSLRSQGLYPLFAILTLCSPGATPNDDGVLPAKAPSRSISAFEGVDEISSVADTPDVPAAV